MAVGEEILRRAGADQFETCNRLVGIVRGVRTLNDNAGKGVDPYRGFDDLDDWAAADPAEIKVLGWHAAAQQRHEILALKLNGNGPLADAGCRARAGHGAEQRPALPV